MAEKLSCARFAGEPTYRFATGDEVVYGAWEKSTVIESFHDGLVYEIETETHKKGEKVSGRQIVSWIDIRPHIVGMSSFTTNRDIRLSYSSVTIESLLYRHLHFGVDFEPDYQRGEVWSMEDKEKLLESIFMGADIGRFVFRCRSEEEWRRDRLSYEIVDGKQRLLTLLAFFENRFPYKGVYFNELSGDDRRRFQETIIALAELKHISKKDVLRVFLMLNRGGRTVSDEHIQRVEKMLSEQLINVSEKSRSH